MSDLRIKNFGDTANGKVSGSMPNGNLNVPEWKNVDVVGNLINMYYANEKNNRENEALQLGKAKQDLDEQRFAYNAAQNEIAREDAFKFKKMDQEFEIDKILREKKFLQDTENAKRKRYSEIGNLLNLVRGDGSAIEYLNNNKDFLESHNGKYNLLEIYDVAVMLDRYRNINYLNNGVNDGNNNNIVNGGNVITIGGSFQGEKNGV